MELIVVLVVGVVLGIPAIAIIALVRSATTRRLLEEYAADLHREANELRVEVATLHKDLGQFSQRVAESGARVPSPAVQSPPVPSQGEQSQAKPVPAAAWPAQAREPLRAPVQEP